MLGLNSIEQTSHRLEDSFKLLKECRVQVDQKLESLFLRVFDTLKELVEQLSASPFVLSEEVAAQIMSGVEPVFEELNAHLTGLVSHSGLVTPAQSGVPQGNAPQLKKCRQWPQIALKPRNPGQANLKKKVRCS